MSDSRSMSSDHPIRFAHEDRLGRSTIAHEVARDLRYLDASNGVVVGILGPWGSGKSSFVNLMKEHFLERPALTVIEFNPWMFSGTEQLVDHFFVELAAQFKHLEGGRFSKAAGLLEEYGESISSVAGLFGIWGQVFTGGMGLARIGARRRLGKKSAGARHDELSSELAKIDNPIVVVIDDIDRLTTPEIRDIFKLVRLTASFPNLIYVLAFDRERVEAALDETNVPGRAYLEKIIQVAYDLPAVSESVLRSEILSGLQNLMEEIEGERFDPTRWSDVFIEILCPLVKNMRDVARLALSARSTVLALASDIEIVDILAMEAVRVFRPELFTELRSMRAALTQTADGFGGANKKPEHQAQIDKLLEISGGDKSLVKALVGRIFPAASRYVDNNNYGSSWTAVWRKSHRMASGDFLGMYFDRVAPSGFQAFKAAESLLGAMNEPERFGSALDSVPVDILPDVLGAMESFEGEFPESRIELVIAGLLDVIPRVPADEYRMGGLFALKPEIIVIRVVLRMIKQLRDAEREAAVRLSLDLVRSYSSKLSLINTVGHREGVGSGVVSEAFAQALERALVAEVLADAPIDLDLEWDLARVYHFVGTEAGVDAILATRREPDFTRAILESVKGENRSQSMDARHVVRTPVLAWEWLLGLYGDEESLADAVHSLRGVDGETDTIKLAEKYLGGWRPDREDRWATGVEESSEPS